MNPEPDWFRLRDQLITALEQVSTEPDLMAVAVTLADLWEYSAAAASAVVTFRDARGSDEVDAAFVALQLAIRNLEWNNYRFAQMLGELDKQVGRFVGYEPDVETVADVSRQIGDRWADEETRGSVASAILELRRILPAIIEELRYSNATEALSELGRRQLAVQLEAAERSAASLRSLLQD